MSAAGAFYDVVIVGGGHAGAQAAEAKPARHHDPDDFRREGVALRATAFVKGIVVGATLVRADPDPSRAVLG